MSDDLRAALPEPDLRLECLDCDVSVPLTYLNAAEVARHVGHSCVVREAAGE
jgi:hypothetical protein